jgi:hypothetical protein
MSPSAPKGPLLEYPLKDDTHGESAQTGTKGTERGEGDLRRKQGYILDSEGSHFCWKTTFLSTGPSMFVSFFSFSTSCTHPQLCLRHLKSVDLRFEFGQLLRPAGTGIRAGVARCFALTRQSSSSLREHDAKLKNSVPCGIFEIKRSVN